MEAAPAPVAAPSLYGGVGLSRQSAAQMISLADVTFTLESLERSEVQDLLKEKLETFLRAVEADPTTRFPVKTSRSEQDGPRNEKKWVCKFLGVDQTLSKKAMAVEMLKAVCKLRGVQSEYLDE